MKYPSDRSNTIIFDFAGLRDSTDWQIVNDDVMGGVSSSCFEILDGVGAVFSGVVSLKNNGGFASVRSLPARHDLTGCGGFVIRTRGDGRRYKFTVRTEMESGKPFYQAAFTTKRGEWEEHPFALKDFTPTFRGNVLTGVPPLNPAKVMSLGFLIADKQAGAFRLEIAWIKASPANS